MLDFICLSRLYLLMRVFLCIVFLFACGCATSHQETTSVIKDSGFPASVITVTRPNQFIGGGVPFKIYDDTNYIGKLGPGGKLSWKRHSDFVTLNCKIDMMGQKENSYNQFYCLPAREYALSVKVVMTSLFDHRIVWQVLSNEVESTHSVTAAD